MFGRYLLRRSAKQLRDIIFEVSKTSCYVKSLILVSGDRRGARTALGTGELPASRDQYVDMHLRAVARALLKARLAPLSTNQLTNDTRFARVPHASSFNISPLASQG